jgi:hypothetical protein
MVLQAILQVVAPVVVHPAIPPLQILVVVAVVLGTMAQMARLVVLAL